MKLKIENRRKKILLFLDKLDHSAHFKKQNFYIFLNMQNILGYLVYLLDLFGLLDYFWHK